MWMTSRRNCDGFGVNEGAQAIAIGSKRAEPSSQFSLTPDPDPDAT
jgi:hypothetical protein